MTDVRRMMHAMSTNTDQHGPTVPEWTLGWRLQRALGHAGLTTEAIAQELEVSRSTVSRWMNDHGSAPRALYVKEWALRTGVPYVWLATGVEPSDGPGGQEEAPTIWKAKVVPLRRLVAA